MPPIPARSGFSAARLCLALLALTLASAASIGLAQTWDADPLPILRLVVEPRHVEKVLDKVPQGLLQSMPLPEFDARVARIRQAHRQERAKPRLTRAHYAAELNDLAFTSGSGQWSVQHAGAAAAVLPIAPFSLAVGKPKWEGGGDAILAELDGKSLGLLVQPGAAHTCRFAWSARGTPTNDGITFTLAVPPCPLTTFEFTLPADYWLFVAKETALATGPFAAESPTQRLWRIQMAETKPLQLLVRKIAEPKGPAPTMFARVESKQVLAAGRLSADFDFSVDILHGSVRTLTLEGDAALQPYEVSLKSGEVKSWQWTELPSKKAGKGKPGAPARGQLSIQFHRPVAGTLEGLKVRSLAAVPAGDRWLSPGLRVVNATRRGESLLVQWQPDVALGTWDAGTFELMSITTDPDGTRNLLLADTASDTASSRRPALFAPANGIDLHTTETCQWHIEPGGATLASDIQYAPSRGSLLQLRLKLPKIFPGYRIESVTVDPPELLRDWHPVGGLLVVELKKPLAAPKKARVIIHMRSGFRELTTGTRLLAYPEIEPLDATKRQGAVRVFVDPIFRTQLVNSSAPISASADDAPENQPMPNYRFACRDQRFSAVVRIVPRSAQAQLRGSHALHLADGQARMRFRWEVAPSTGAPEFLDFRFAPGFPASWKLIEDEGLKIHHWERLLWNESLPHLMPLGCQDEWQAAWLQALLPKGTHWRFYLSEPLRRKSSFAIETTLAGWLVEADWRRVALGMPCPSPWGWINAALAAHALPKTDGAKIWSLPLMSPVQRTNVEEDFVVESPQEPIGKIDADGALETQPPTADAKTPLRARLRQALGDDLDPSSRIVVRTRPDTRPKSVRELCDEATLTSFVHRDGRVFHRVQFRLWNWHDRSFEIRYPPDVQILAVKIHDRWVQRVETEPGPAHRRLTLPFDQNAEFVRYEILARSEAGGAFVPGLKKIALPTLDWPVAPLEVAKRVFLESDLTPLSAETLTPVGVPAGVVDRAATPDWLRRVWTWGQAWWPGEGRVRQQKKLDEQKRRVLAHEAQLRQSASKALKLSEALERFAFGRLKDSAALIIDATAMRSLGLSPQSMVPVSALSPQASRPFWEALGLTYLPCPSGAVLTTTERLARWGIEPAEWDGAVQEAILHGRDASGGFFLVPNWLTLPPREVAAFRPLSPTQAGGGFERDAQMVEWSLRGHVSASEGIWIIDPAPARTLVWIAALVLAVAAWRLGRAVPVLTGLRVFVLLSACAGAAIIWLPAPAREILAWPALLVAGAGLLWHVARLVGANAAEPQGGNSTVSQVAAGSAVLLALLLGLPWDAPAQTPAANGPFRVLVIEGEKPVALVSPELAAVLADGERPVPIAKQQAVLTAAKYTGKIAGAEAKFAVQYEIFSLADQANLVIPLGGVQLQEGAILDGAPVYPVAHPGGFALPVRGKGAHQLRLSFTARVSLASDESKLFFTIPRLVQNEVAIDWAAAVQGIHCPRCFGEEKQGTGQQTATKEWRAQLGYEDALLLRWTNALAPAAGKTFDVGEAHFWDLRPSSLSLRTSLAYSLGKNSLTQLAVTMPDGLHVRAVEATWPPAKLAAKPILVKNWRIAGKGPLRRLLVEFVQPVAGQFTIHLEIIPSAFGPKNQFVLALPAPVQGKSSGGLLGYRLDALEKVPAQQNLSVTGIPAEDFAKRWSEQKLPKIASASRAYLFQRSAQQAAWIPNIEPTPLQTRAELQWSLERHFAHLRGNFTIRSPFERLSVLEFHIDPAVTLAEVAGSDVANWVLQDGRLQVWLWQARKETTIAMTGWRAFATKGNMPLPKAIALPKIYPLQTALVDSTLEIRAAADVQAIVDQPRGLRPTGGGPLAFAIEAVPYQATLRLETRSSMPIADVLTKVQAADSGVEIWHGVRLTTERGRLPTLTLRVRDWPYAPLVLEAPGASVQSATAKNSADRTWTLKYPPGLPQEVVVVLRGRVPQGRRAPFPVPAVQFVGAAPRSRWLAWRGVDVQTPDGKKIAPPRLAKKTPAHPIGTDFFGDGAGWSFTENAAATLQVALPESPARANTRLLAQAEEVWLTDDGDWRHGASLWLHAPQGAPLRIRFADAVGALNSWIDGRPHSAGDLQAGEFIVTLDADPNPRLVHLRWKYAAAAETPDAPILAPIRLDLPAPAARQRLLWIAPGMTARGGEAPTFVERALQDAALRVQLSAALALETPRGERAKKAIASAQARVAAGLRQAEYAALALQALPRDVGGAAFAARVLALRMQNEKLAKLNAYDSERLAGEKLKDLPPAQDGLREHAGVPRILSANAATLTIRLDAERLSSEQRMQTELLLLGAIFCLVFSYFRHGWSLLRVVLPEAVAALAIAGMLLWGVGILGASLLVLAVMVRIGRLTAAWRQRWTASLPATALAKDPSSPPTQ